MIQKDYYLRMIEEFGRALANFMERRHDAARRDREMADLYRQYVGDYTLVRNLSVEETMVYAHDQWADDERIGRLGMLAELLYARPPTVLSRSVRCSTTRPTSSMTM